MGYTCDYTGQLVVRNNLEKTRFKKILDDAFEEDFDADVYYDETNDGNLYANFNGYGKYSGNIWVSLLHKVRGFATGYIEFVGEDQEMWRLRITDTNVIEEIGETYYGDLTAYYIEKEGDNLPPQLLLDLQKWQGAKKI